jgi:hypothetical protein
MHTAREEQTFDADADWNAGTHANTVASGGALTLVGGQTSGSWTSTIIDRGDQVDGLPLGEWTATLPAGAALVVETRVSKLGDGSDWSAWAPQQSPGSRKPLASHRDISEYVASAKVSRQARMAGACTLTINDPNGDLKGLFQRWDDLVVWQGWQAAGEPTDKAKLRKFRGYVLKAPRRADTPTTTYSIEAAGYTGILARNTAPRVWDNKRADEILIDAITTFGPRYIGTSRVQTNSETTPYRSKYLKIIRILEDMAKATGWAGWVDDDLEFRWENPSGKIAPALSVAAGNIVAGSASFEQVGPFLNDLTVFGGLFRTENFTDDKFNGDALRATYPLLYFPRNIVVKVKNTSDPDSAYAPLTCGVDGLHTFADGYASLFNYQQKVLKFPATMAGKTIWARYQYDLPVRARVRDSVSILRYGPLQDVLVDTSIRDKEAAVVFAKAKVREGARKRWEGGLRPMGPAIMEGKSTWPYEPGQLVPVQIPSIDLDHQLELVEETMDSTGSTLLQVSFSLKEP